MLLVKQVSSGVPCEQNWPSRSSEGASLGAPRYPADVVAAALGVPAVDFLGGGAFGDTWRAGDTAIKIICADGYPPERVRREIDGLSRVTSPNIVKLIEAKSVILDSIDRPALVFEYISGGDVEGRIQAGAWPSVAEVMACMKGLLVGVRDLHASAGTVHRDIKPANIALRDGAWDSPVLLDLGLARSMDESTITVYPGRVGTPPFMAPEQIAGQRARKAADLFAVGVTIRLLLGHVHPFYEPGIQYTVDEAIKRIENSPVPLPASVPGPIASLLDRLVSAAEYERGSARSSLRRMQEAGL
jgi:serine/threonine protein kinase